MGQREVDLTQLFSDVSRTIGDITSIMGVGSSQDSAADPSHSGNGPSTVAGSMFGNTCIRACGIEDIQYAARSAGDMFIALRFCIVFSTIGFLLCMIVLTATITYMICSKTPSRRLPLPAFVREVFPSRSDPSKDNQSS